MEIERDNDTRDLEQMKIGWGVGYSRDLEGTMRAQRQDMGPQSLRGLPSDSMAPWRMCWAPEA